MKSVITSCQIPNHLHMMKIIYVGKLSDSEVNDYCSLYCMNCLTIQRPCPSCRENSNIIIPIEIIWESKLG